MTTTAPFRPPVSEENISAMVRRFYALGFEDDLLAPIFRAIPRLEEHLVTIDDFWSHAILGTKRYSGHPYAHHTHLTVEESHFDRWLAAFEQAVRETLPQWAADQAMARARHMTQSFKAGMLPLPEVRGKAE